ncbi:MULTISPECIES: AAA family ATPase [Dehalobacter]|jgi:CO dehydrogenase maturation factor|uniref:AAA family ATPase n=2 Tax=Dehalobacter restrictus TaxID=55583 RepID=A0A857DEQ3_9FIRM|nr:MULTISPECIES: carbon monoxide dehydrogenase accessory protein CooC [Dehalobacter]AHF08838.1 carbon monoxide dehydrogenase [Dehalobacter restrictus DSM 9455]MCG1024141.1 AAA family ATPase [Dehalobacter sp.]OCZ50014.1 carbon monoxide dehydrogenase [Dehalobacter sp. TeCB1]QGZ99336.1 AAA family ATPase [Dehalobacter restrictus]
MKIAITGKGGVGKTTFAAILSRLYAAEGYRVLAVDADPDANLALALGFPDEIISKIVPIAEMKELIAERTSTPTDSFSKIFKLNPQVDDIPDKYCTCCNGVNLLTMGTVESGGSGCVCPEHVLLKRLTSHLVLQNKDVVVMDMEAGIEHLGRGTAQGVNTFIVVVEPGARSLQTYHKIKKLASDIGIPKIYAVGNKIKNDLDKAYILENIDPEACLGFISYNVDVVNSDRPDQSPFMNSKIVEEVKAIKLCFDLEKR